MVEQAAVNRKVEGSNPFSGAKKHDRDVVLYFFLLPCGASFMMRLH